MAVYNIFCNLALIIFYGTPPKSTSFGHSEWLLLLKSQLMLSWGHVPARLWPGQYGGAPALYMVVGTEQYFAQWRLSKERSLSQGKDLSIEF